MKMTISILQAGLILGRVFGLLDWSWFWVFIPLYFELTLVAVILGLAWLRDRQIKKFIKRV